MKRILVFFGAVFFTLTSAEFGARYWLGLGTPPLSEAHPSIEYMFSPNQDVYRFGNRQLYNEYGMRAVPLDQVTQPRRVLVFGDSVLNGGNLSDHNTLATTLATGPEVFYGNVSAGSWGPANMVAWIKEYGLLDAETAIVVISSHDLHDAPTFEPLNPRTHPTERPISALFEGIERYLPRYLPSIFSGGEPEISPPKQVQVSTAGAISELIDRVEKSGVKLCVIQHKTQDEIGLPSAPDSKEINEIFKNRGVPILDFGKALATPRDNPYRDNIHINDYGQKLLAEYLRQCSEIARLPRQRIPDHGGAGTQG